MHTFEKFPPLSFGVNNKLHTLRRRDMSPRRQHNFQHVSCDTRGSSKQRNLLQLLWKILITPCEFRRSLPAGIIWKAEICLVAKEKANARKQRKDRSSAVHWEYKQQLKAKWIIFFIWWIAEPNELRLSVYDHGHVSSPSTIPLLVLRQTYPEVVLKESHLHSGRVTAICKRGGGRER